MGNDIIIVGAGMAGLSAGCHAQMNGYRSRIFESHVLPGGLCTAWKRKGYVFDTSIHMLMSSTSGMFHRLWQELGVLQGRQFVHHDTVLHIETMGRKVDIFADLDRLERELLALSPGDAKLTRELIRMARQLVGFEPEMGKPRELWGPLDHLKQLRGTIPLLGVLGETTGVRWPNHSTFGAGTGQRSAGSSRANARNWIGALVVSRCDRQEGDKARGGRCDRVTVTSGGTCRTSRSE